jgi:hypothetical protein
MLNESTPDLSNANLDRILRNTFLLKTFTIADFQRRIEQLELIVLCKKTGLIVIDSIASIVRREFSGTDSSILHERSIFLSKISNRLKCIAEMLNVSVSFKAKNLTQMLIKSKF